jgi:hypothetical protein
VSEIAGADVLQVTPEVGVSQRSFIEHLEKSPWAAAEL